MTTARDADSSLVDPSPAASHPGGSAAAHGGPGAPAPAPAGPEASGSAPIAHLASDPPATAVPVPETDAFGPTVRHGELPAVFQNMSLDADVLHLGPTPPNGDEAPDAGPPPFPAPPAPPEPEDGLE